MLLLGVVLFIIGCAVLYAHTCLLTPLMRVENITGFAVFLLAIALITGGGWIATDSLAQSVFPQQKTIHHIQKSSYRGVI